MRNPVEIIADVDLGSDLCSLGKGFGGAAPGSSCDPRSTSGLIETARPLIVCEVVDAADPVPATPAWSAMLVA